MIRGTTATELDAADVVAQVCDLALGEALLLWSIRMWARDQSSWWRVEAEFRRACAPTVARTALTAWGETITLLAGRARAHPASGRGARRDPRRGLDPRLGCREPSQ